jgi:hypothetical protein
MSAVVVSRKAAQAILGDPLDLAQSSGGVDLSDVDVPASLVGGGDIGDAIAGGGPSRLEVYCPVRQQCLISSGGKVQQPEFDGIVSIRAVDHPFSLGGPIGLVIVPWTLGELPCFLAP